MIKIVPVRSYRITKDDTNKLEDDWGVPIGSVGKAHYKTLDDEITKNYKL